MFLGTTLSFLISVVDQLQIIIHLPILNIQIPANGMEFFSIAVPIVTYDIFENLSFYLNFIKSFTRNYDEKSQAESGQDLR